MNTHAFTFASRLCRLCGNLAVTLHRGAHNECLRSHSKVRRVQVRRDRAWRIWRMLRAGPRGAAAWTWVLLWDAALHDAERKEMSK